MTKPRWWPGLTSPHQSLWEQEEEVFVMRNSNTRHPLVKGSVRAVRRLQLPVKDGQILPGDLWPYRPFPYGATVVIDVQDGYWMHRRDAETVGAALSHCTLQIEGDDQSKIVGDQGFGRIFGIEAIADVIAGAARLQAQHDIDMEVWA